MTVRASSMRIARLDSDEWVEVGGVVDFTIEPHLDAEPVEVPRLTGASLSIRYRLDRRQARILRRILAGWYRYRARLVTRRKYIARRRRS